MIKVEFYDYTSVFFIFVGFNCRSRRKPPFFAISWHLSTKFTSNFCLDFEMMYMYSLIFQIQLFLLGFTIIDVFSLAFLIYYEGGCAISFDKKVSNFDLFFLSSGHWSIKSFSGFWFLSHVGTFHFNRIIPYHETSILKHIL